jgi:hypothetical protein
MKLAEYKSKYENYDIGQRLADLKDIVEIQCSKGNFDQGEYMRGMANGLLLAWYIMREPYGAEVPYFDDAKAVRGQLAPQIAALKAEIERLKAKDAELIRVLNEMLGSNNRVNPHLGVAAGTSLLKIKYERLQAALARAKEALEFYGNKENWGTYPEDFHSGKNALLMKPDSEHYSCVWVGHRARQAVIEIEKLEKNEC